MLLKRLGKAPKGERLKRIKQSPNYVDGKFVNRTFTPQLSEGYSFQKVFFEAFVKSNSERRPKTNIPTMYTDLKSIASNKDVLIWFGHSSYYFQIDGMKFLVDPVFSNNVSPIWGTSRVFKGTNIYSHKDIPEIDYLLLTHDHYDHLDYRTIKRIKPKIKNVICGLGLGSHLEYWNYNPNIIYENDWFESLKLPQGFILHILPARHFSGRTFRRNNTLWISFLLETPTQKIYLGGDSGYDTHFKEIGQQFKTIDWAILENGQYHKAWKYIHCLPNETLQAAKDMNAKRILPVHNSKFSLSPHAWNEPHKEIIHLNTDHQHIITPKIGEIIYLNDTRQSFERWWNSL